MVVSAEQGDDVHMELERLGMTTITSKWYERGAHHTHLMLMDWFGGSGSCLLPACHCGALWMCPRMMYVETVICGYPHDIRMLPNKEEG